MERPIIRMPGIPSGEKLIQITVQCANQALVETYPMLGNHPFRERLLTEERLCFQPAEKIKQLERTDRPYDENMICLSLKLMGVAEDKIQRMLYSAADAHSAYWNRTAENPTMYFSDDFLADFSAPDSSRRAENACYLGIIIINETLAMLARPNVLSPQTEWREVVRVRLDQSFRNLEADFKECDPEKLAITKGNMTYILDQESQIVAYGAMVLLLHDDTKTIETTMGVNFETGTRNYLASDASMKFLRLMKDRSIILRVPAFPPMNRSMRDAMDIYRDINTINLRGEQILLQAYLGSMIPSYYHASRKKRAVDPWIYPN